MARWATIGGCRYLCSRRARFSRTLRRAQPPLPVQSNDNNNATDNCEDDLYEDVDGRPYASAAPPPVPDDALLEPSPIFNPGQQAARALNLPQEMSVQPTECIGNIVAGEEVGPRGIAAANRLYEQGTHLNHRSGSGQHELTTSAAYGCVEGASQTETTCSLSRSSLYSQSHNVDYRTYPGQYNLTATTSNCEEGGNQTETSAVLSRSSLYGQRSGHRTLARDITRTDDHTAEAVNALYESM
ncbi:hypothetical protein Bbelb_013970 [Branchiostoma belcheri]|nr:hypothetical protein Bbelb_013970 [Branchiostoma belcheri]